MALLAMVVDAALSIATIRCKYGVVSRSRRYYFIE